MFRPARVRAASRPPASRRRVWRQRRMCVGAMASAAILYLASPYMALWSMGAALRLHDDAALQSSLDWKLVRAGLKDSLGLDHPVRQVSQQDELPGFGDSFASGVASGMIDDDITPQRLGSMLSSPSIRSQAGTRLPHGFFTSPTRFEARIASGTAPIEITMQIEDWRWKITRITVPDALLNPPAATRVAARS